MASFDENGKYIKTNWKAGDRITATKLNKIEESIEAVNDNDISRHVEADARLDALEAKNTAQDKELTNVKNTIANNKAAAELGDYEINSRMQFLEEELEEAVAEVDGKIATAEANMAAQVIQGKNDMAAQVNQGKADMEAMVAEVEADLEGLHAKDEEFSGQLMHIEKHLNVNVLDFGAVGDGVVDDTKAIQNAIDSVNSNATIIFPSGYKFNITEVIINKTNINLCGGGEILNGYFYLKYDTITQSFVKITNLTFSSESRSGYGIKFKNTRRNTITNCNFDKKDKALYVPPHIEETEDDEDALFHSVGLLNINDNFFNNVNYCLYIDYNTDENNDNTLISNRWMRTNDIHFVNNYINVMKYCAIWCRGVDGIIINSNTIFSDSSPLKPQEKEQNIYIGKTDWLLINSNNLFEAGLESIKVEECKRVNIVGNNIAWCGQRKASSGIVLGDSPIGIVANNIISQPTKHGIEITSGYLSITNNLIQFDVDNPIPTTYYGNTDEISSIKHYSIHSGGYCKLYNNTTTSNMYVKDRNTEYIENMSGVSHFTFSYKFEGGETVKVSESCRYLGNYASTNLGGLIYVRIQFHNGSNSASYLLLLEQSSKAGVVEIAKTGVVGQTSSTNWCNFTFTSDSDGAIYVTSNNSIGEFVFYFTTLGDIKMGSIRE